MNEGIRIEEIKTSLPVFKKMLLDKYEDITSYSYLIVCNYYNYMVWLTKCGGGRGGWNMQEMAYAKELFNK